MREPPVIRCPPALRTEALTLLRAARDPAQREGLAQALEMAGASGDDVWDGLFVALDERPRSALWMQLTAGNAAVIWPPPSDDRYADGLFRAAAAYADERRLGVAQMIVSAADGFDADAMERRGFARLAELIYMFAELSGAPSQRAHSSQTLQFLPFAGNDLARLGAIVEQTYQDTRDCPVLDDARTASEVLEGYRFQGEHRPEHWYVVAEDGRDVGVLLMAAHPDVDSWELIYMGVAPEARGRRLGEAIARIACDVAQRNGAERLVLAVDAANDPAQTMYRRAGFLAWDRRVVFARLGSAAASSRRG